MRKVIIAALGFAITFGLAYCALAAAHWPI